MGSLLGICWERLNALLCGLFEFVGGLRERRRILISIVLDGIFVCLAISPAVMPASINLSIGSQLYFGGRAMSLVV